MDMKMVPIVINVNILTGVVARKLAIRVRGNLGVTAIRNCSHQRIA